MQNIQTIQILKIVEDKRVCVTQISQLSLSAHKSNWEEQGYPVNDTQLNKIANTY